MSFQIASSIKQRCNNLMAEEKIISEHVDAIEAKTDLTLEPEVTWTEEEETRVRRKLDWQIVPMVTVLYLMW